MSELQADNNLKFSNTANPAVPVIPPPNNPANKDTVQFTTAMATKSGQPKDYFVEQNQKQAEKKAQYRKKLKFFLLLSIIPCACLIALITILVIHSNNESATSPIAATIYFDDKTVNEDMIDLRNLATGAFNTVVVEESDGQVTINGDIDAANEVFNAALSVPQNDKYSSQINLSRIIFYLNNGRYDLVIKSLDNIDTESLTTAQRASYYNTVAMACYYIGDEEKSAEYTRLAQNAQAELGEFGG